jgi:uncharacterized protein (DUF362 family)
MTHPHVVQVAVRAKQEREQKRYLSQPSPSNSIKGAFETVGIVRAAVREHSAHFPNEPIAYGRGTSVSLRPIQIDTRANFFASRT